MDIVRIFENYCMAKEFYFSYGTKAVQNLLTAPHDFTADKVHILLDPVRRTSNFSSTGMSVPTRTYQGRYLLVLRDDFDLHFFNEKCSDEATSKYSTRIEPLLPVYAALEKQFIACDGYEIIQHENVDVTDALDANLTGLVCTFKIKVYE